MTIPLLPKAKPPPRALSAAIAEDWQEWIGLHNRRVVVSLLAMGVPLDVAEELSQTAWERLMQKHRAGQLDRIDMPGLALQQARFLALDYLGKVVPKQLRHEPIYDHALVSAESNSPSVLVARESLERAQEVLLQSSDKAQIAFRLFYIENSSAPEIAADLGISAQRVRQILCELRQKIRSKIGDAHE